MDDIKEYLREKDAIAACFRMRGGQCKVMIATKSQDHLNEIIEDWGQVEVDNSDLKYLFHNIAFLSREEQICLIQSKIEAEDATPLIQAEEQKVASVCSKYGADRVCYSYRGDKMEFLINGHLDEEAMSELKEIDTNYKHIYMNPPRCRFTIIDGEVEALEAVGPVCAQSVAESGERLI